MRASLRPRSTGAGGSTALRPPVGAVQTASLALDWSAMPGVVDQDQGMWPSFDVALPPWWSMAMSSKRGHGLLILLCKRRAA